jgi:hypothetical protein
MAMTALTGQAAIAAAGLRFMIARAGAMELGLAATGF